MVAGSTSTVRPAGQLGLAVPPLERVASGNANAQEITTPSLVTSILCIPDGNAPLAVATVARTWSWHPTSPHAFVHPLVKTGAQRMRTSTLADHFPTATV